MLSTMTFPYFSVKVLLLSSSIFKKNFLIVKYIFEEIKHGK